MSVEAGGMLPDEYLNKALVIEDKDHQGLGHVIDTLKQFFPKAFEKPSIENPVESAVLNSG